MGQNWGVCLVQFRGWSWGGVSGYHPGESLCGFGGGPGRTRCLQSEGQEPGSNGVTGSALRPGAGGSQLTCLSEVSTGGRV